MRAIVLFSLLHATLAVVPNPWNGPTSGTPTLAPGSVCKTDQGSCGCCLITQEVNRLKTYFTTTLDNIEKDHSQTKQTLSNIEDSRTAFSVGLFTEKHFQCNGPHRNDKNIIYKNVFLNLGGSYSVSTGIFTVPHSGVYTLAVTGYSDAGSPGSLLAACASLQVNGQVVAKFSDNNRDDQEDSATIAVVLRLKVGDKVAVNLPSGCFLCDENSHYNTFSGFLLYE